VESRVGEFLDDVAAWGREQGDVHGVVLLGSQARADVPADELSDVDVVLFVDEPERYLRDHTWLAPFGEPLLSHIEATAVGGFEERRVLFRDGLEVDFAIVPAAALADLPPAAAEVFARGFRVLYDDGIKVEPPEIPLRAPLAPTQAQLDELANEFWYHLLWGAKKLRRGEVLLAKQVCDCTLKRRIVELARWRAQETDTWHDLRFFEHWAGKDVVEALGPTFASYDAAEVARALRATGELFGRLEAEVASRFGLTSPVDRAEILHRVDVTLP